MTTTPTDQPVISAAVIVEDGTVLLVQRRIAEGELLWQFPAGATEVGETTTEAAVRETREETGLVVHSLALLGERVHPKTGRRMAYVACSRESGTAYVADDEELSAVAWVKPTEFAEYVPYGFAPVVNDYLNSCGLIT